VNEYRVGFPVAFLTDGTVWGWGDGRYQKGTDQAGVDSCSPVKAFLP
jgi:hypothetical protein